MSDLPAAAERGRVIDSKQMAELYGYSLSHFRTLYRRKLVPPPIKISDRKLGWRLGDALDDLARRASEARAA